MTDAELALVADVARREAWPDPASPPATHGPRSIAEMRAVGRFEERLAAAGAATRPAPGWRSRLSYAAKVRIAMIAAAVVVLGACWWVSPARTALGLLGAGVVCLVAMRRSRRRAGPPPRRPIGLWGATTPRRR